MLYRIDMTLGKRICEARKRLKPKVTQRALGKMLGVSDKAVSGWERDQDIPENQRMPEIAKALHVTVNWLWDGGGPAPDKDSLAVQIEALTTAEQRAVEAFIQHLKQQRRGVA